MRRGSVKKCCALSKASSSAPVARAPKRLKILSRHEDATAAAMAPAYVEQPKQSNIDAAKKKPPPPRRPNSSRPLDVNILLGKLKIRLRLPQRRSQSANTRTSVIDCMKDCLVPSRRQWDSWVGVDSSDDESPSRMTKPARHKRKSGIDCMKDCLVPSRRQWSPRAMAQLARRREEKPQSAKGFFASFKILHDIGRTGCGAAFAAGKNGCGAALVWTVIRGSLRFLSQQPLAAPKVCLGIPLILCLLWFQLVRPVVVLLGPLSAYAALTCSVPALVAQCYVVSFPLAGSVAPTLGAFSKMVDKAFADLANGVETMLARSLRFAELPLSLEEQVAHVLASPLVAAISVVRFLLPDFEAMLPKRLKRPETLAPVVFVLLLALLFFGQAIPLLFLGLAGQGDLCVFMCILISTFLSGLAFFPYRVNCRKAAPQLANETTHQRTLHGAQVLALALFLVECIINFLIQYLLRKVIHVKALQRLLDVASDPKQALGLVRQDKGEELYATVTDGIVQVVHKAPGVTEATYEDPLPEPSTVEASRTVEPSAAGAADLLVEPFAGESSVAGPGRAEAAVLPEPGAFAQEKDERRWIH